MLSMVGHPSGGEPLMMDVRQSGSGPAGPSSNADAPDRTDANRLEHVDADHPKHRTAPDGFDTDRACLLIRGSRVRALEGRHPALGAPHLIAEIHRVLATYYDRRTGARLGIDQAAHALPDVPVRELGRVRPPVRDILMRGSPGLRLLLVLHRALPASLEALGLGIEQNRTEQNSSIT
jgi:hypothetical protein